VTEPRNLNTRYPPVTFDTLAGWEAYAAWLRRHVRVSLALEPEAPRSPLKARVFGRWEGDGYRCEKVHFESLPGFRVTGNLFRPMDGPLHRPTDGPLHRPTDGPRHRPMDGAPAARIACGSPRRCPGILCPHGHWADGRLHDRDPRGSDLHDLLPDATGLHLRKRTAAAAGGDERGRRLAQMQQKVLALHEKKRAQLGAAAPGTAP